MTRSPMSRVLLGMALGWSGTPTHGATALTTLPEGVRQPTAQRYVGGHLTQSMLQALAQAGVRHVVSVSPPAETTAFDEAGESQRLGLAHHQLEVRGPADLTPATVVAFDRVLVRIGDAPALLHCASGNRVGALMALRAGWLQGQGVEEALQIGRAHGLTRLETEVRQRLLDAAAAAQAIESAGSRTDS